MNKAVKVDLGDLLDAIEHLHKTLPTLDLAQQIDVAARLKPLAKHCEQIDETVKDAVKAKLKGKAGAVPGEIFKAVLNLVSVTRLDQKALKEEEPEVHAEYSKQTEDQRVTYSVR